VTQVIFATLPIASKLVLPSIEPLGIATCRIFGAGLAFAVVQRIRRSGSVSAPCDLFALLGLALLGVVVNRVLFMEGVKRTTAVHASIPITTIPAFILAVALVLGRERLSAQARRAQAHRVEPGGDVRLRAAGSRRADRAAGAG
jgi:drug/metabolite transporter (DMT)-like permease